MLDALEARFTAVVGDVLAPRAHLEVRQGPDEAGALAAGEGVVRVALVTAAPAEGFARDRFRLLPEGPPASRRVLPVSLTLEATFLLEPMGPPNNRDLGASRQRLLADVSLLAHALGGRDASDGSLFRPAAPDPGFIVRRFSFAGADLAAGLDEDGRLAGTWRADLDAEVWPVGVTDDEGLIDAIDILVAGQPLRISADRSRLRTGQRTEVRVASVTPDRLAAVDAGDRAPTRMAIGVISDLPPADRGTIEGGDPADVAGFRVVAIEAESGIARFDYVAPAGDLGTTRAESVAIHLATPGDGVGTLIGGLTLGLAPGGGG